MLLALDTSTERLGLALFDGHQVWSEVVWQVGRHHTRTLVPWMYRLLESQGVTPDQVRVIGVATGPGSFTGLRAGMAVAKALALALGVQLVGVFSLDVAAASVPPQSPLPLMAVLPMGRGRLAVGRYHYRGGQWHADGPPLLMTPQELVDALQEPTLVAGEMSTEIRQELAQSPLVRLAPPPWCVRRPAWLAQLAWERWQKGLVDDPVTLNPYYLSSRTA